MRKLALLLLVACSSDPGGVPIDPSAALLGGDTTIFDSGDEAFNYPARNLRQEMRGAFQIGDGVFNRNWVTAPATPEGNDGLGPTYNALSCSACHVNNGRASTPATPDEPFLGLLLRLSIFAGTDAHGGPMPVPNYGTQLQNFAILGVPAEGRPHVMYTEMPGRFPDGEVYSLRFPSYSIDQLAFGDLPADILISPRMGPQMVGLGLLEAVSEDTILGFAAQNGGKPNRVWDVTKQATVLGRFGWKANQPSLEQQTFGAFVNDIGITSAMFPDDNCPPVQTACAQAPQSLVQPNLEAVKADAMVVHAMALAVPARRNVAETMRGEALFNEIGCASCHIPKMVTGTLDGWPELSNQTIRPFTDLLLHDMGPELADGRPDYLASETEWRTPPLWGLGLCESINGYLFLMHDGRARNFVEAILWHAGAAQMARDTFYKLPKTDRDQLVSFLKSL